MEERSEGILLRPTGPVVQKLSWEDTAREMAANREELERMGDGRHVIPVAGNSRIGGVAAGNEGSGAQEHRLGFEKPAGVVELDAFRLHLIPIEGGKGQEKHCGNHDGDRIQPGGTVSE